jgi:hypothetical protein
MLKSSHGPHARLTIACCLQGGGVYVDSGTVTMTSSSIHGNTAGYVRAHVQKFPLPPHGKIADALDSRLLKCERSGQLQNVRATETLETSHHPDGKIADMPARLTLAQLRTLR